MPIVLFFVIALLVAVVTATSKYIESLAFRKMYRQHRFYAYALIITLILVVGVLEWLLRIKVVTFTAPLWLYLIHVASAVLYFLSFIAKWWTASTERRVTHIALSKYYWFFWWLTAWTALAIGIVNAFIPLHP